MALKFALMCQPIYALKKAGKRAVLVAKKEGSSEVIRDSFKEYADD